MPPPPEGLFSTLLVTYVLDLTRFQIAPEERVLLGLFGGECRASMARVRRWL